MGLKVQFAENLAPALFTVFGWIMKLYAVIAKNMNPAFKLMGQIIHDVTQYFKEHHDMLKKLVDVLKFVALAYVAIKIQILAAKAAELAMNAVSSLTNPWVLAIMAVIVVVVLLVKHWNTVKKVANSVVHWVSNAWKNIQHAVTTAITVTINFLKKWWPLIVGIFLGPIGIVTGLFFKFHDQIIGVLQKIIDFVTSIPGKIADVFTSAASTIINAITQPFKDAWHWLSSLQIHIKHTHIGPVSVPSGISVSSAQHGGLRGGLTWVGEAGPELVNLPGGSRVQPHTSTSVGSVQQTDKVMPPFVISVQIQRQEIARAVGKYTTDRLARR
jgi:phage-related protein